MAPQSLRRQAWARLARDLDLSALDGLTTEIALDDALDGARRLMAGEVVGRLVVRIPD
jgi:acrylyl-CoA reductase (NADPH)